MRKNILAAGFTFLAVALLFGLSYPQGLIFSVPVSILNIILGLITRAPPGIGPWSETGSVRLVIDRGIVRASIYQIVFLNSKVILKRLSSAMVTVVLALVLAIVGLELLFIIGALMGGITGFSIQEFLTQRTREKVGTGPRLTQVEKNDIVLNLDELQEVRLIRSRLYLTTEKKAVVASFPRSYSSRLRPLLEKVFGSKLAKDGSV